MIGHRRGLQSFLIWWAQFDSVTDGDNIKPELFPRPTHAKSEKTLFQNE